MADEKLCLKWNDFQIVAQSSFGELRNDSDFTDVTLACEDKIIKANKVILSACSPFFKRLLKTYTHPQPLIYLRKMKSIDLEAIIDFIYLGEANVFQGQLESFLSLAEEFELKGLNIGKEEVAREHPRKSVINRYHGAHDRIESPLVKFESDTKTFDTALMAIYPKDKPTTILTPDTVAKVESLIEGRAGGYSCKNCHYTSKARSHMKEHVERHIEGLEYPCVTCNKICRSSEFFRNHKKRGR